MTDTALFREKVQTSGLKYNFLAKNLGITTEGLRKKIKNEVEFKPSEIVVLCKLLNMTNKERDRIFFAQ